MKRRQFTYKIKIRILIFLLSATFCSTVLGKVNGGLKLELKLFIPNNLESQVT